MIFSSCTRTLRRWSSQKLTALKRIAYMSDRAYTLPRFLQYFSFTCTVLRFCVVVINYMHAVLKAHMYIYASIFTRGRTRRSVVVARPFTPDGSVVRVLASHTFADDFRKTEQVYTRERGRITRRRHTGVDDGKVESRKNKGEEHNKSTSFLSRLGRVGIPCVYPLPEHSAQGI